MKKGYLIILLFIATISLIACTNEPILDKSERSSSDFPTLRVVSENDSVEAEIGTSSWTTNNKDGTKTTIESDTAGPAELVGDVSTLNVSPESIVKLEFSEKPKEVIVNIWEEGNQLEQVLTLFLILAFNNNIGILKSGIEKNARTNYKIADD